MDIAFFEITETIYDTIMNANRWSTILDENSWEVMKTKYKR